MDYELCLISRLVHLQLHCNNNAPGRERKRKKERKRGSKQIDLSGVATRCIPTPAITGVWVSRWRAIHQMANVLGKQPDKNTRREYCCRPAAHLIYFNKWPTSDTCIHCSLNSAQTWTICTQESSARRPAGEMAADETHQRKPTGTKLKFNVFFAAANKIICNRNLPRDVDAHPVKCPTQLYLHFFSFNITNLYLYFISQF